MDAAVAVRRVEPFEVRAHQRGQLLPAHRLGRDRPDAPVDERSTERGAAEEAGEPTYVNPPAKLAVDRLADIMVEATSRGLTRPNKEGDPVLSTSLPPVEQLFDKFEPASPGRGPFLYRLLSGYIHGKQWAGHPGNGRWSMRTSGLSTSSPLPKATCAQSSEKCRPTDCAARTCSAVVVSFVYHKAAHPMSSECGNTGFRPG